MDKQTITVSNGMRDVEVDRERFIKEWVSHIKQLHNLTWKHFDEILEMQSTVTIWANEEFDRLWGKQNEL